MTELEPQPYYRVILKREFNRRVERNGRYSMRAFARDVGLSPQRLSDLLTGRYGISSLYAHRVAKNLNLAGKELQRFVNSAEMFHARNAAARKKATRDFFAEPIVEVDVDSFKTTAEWYYRAILELTLIDGFKSDPKWISEQLDLSESLTQEALERLLKENLLVRTDNGEFKCAKEFTKTPTETPSSAIRSHHKQLLEKALHSADSQTIAERYLGSVTMAIDTARLQEAKEELFRFQNEFMKKYGIGPKYDSVYCFSHQFFSLQKKK